MSNWTYYLTSSNPSKTNALKRVLQHHCDEALRPMAFPEIKVSPCENEDKGEGEDKNKNKNNKNKNRGGDRPNQPIGLEQGFECAKSRILDTSEEALHDLQSIHISVESTLAPSDNSSDSPFAVFDIPCICVYLPLHRVWFRAEGLRVRFPTKYWQILVESGSLGSITGGQVISQCHPTIEHNDWHTDIGDMSREEQILGGLRVVMKRVWAYLKKVQSLRDGMRYFEDFPKPGVRFQDMNSLLENRDLRHTLCDVMERVVGPGLYDPDGLYSVTHIVGLDARGFILGGFLAERLNLPFIPLRKRGKLPGPVWSEDYGKEYGQDILELQKGAFTPRGDGMPRVLIVDDILATGGTLSAALSLLRQAYVHVVGMLVVSQVAELKEIARKTLADFDVPLMVLL